MKKIVFLLFTNLFFICCSSIPEPADQSSTLLIGKIVFSAKGYENFGSSSINGVHKTGINLTIENIKTNEIYVLTTGITGIFYSTNLPAGKYTIKKYLFKDSSQNSMSEMTASHNDLLVFQINPGKVNNLGFISWLAKNGEGVTFNYNNDYSIVHDNFNQEYKNSLWLRYEWINLTLNTHTKNNSFEI